MNTCGIQPIGLSRLIRSQSKKEILFFVLSISHHSMLYEGTTVAFIHVLFIFFLSQFQFHHRKRSNLYFFSSKMFLFLSLFLLELFMNFKWCLFTPFFSLCRLFRYSSYWKQISFFLLYDVHYQLENADECVTMRSKAIFAFVHCFNTL